jgi:hypothetical protein
MRGDRASRRTGFLEGTAPGECLGLTGVGIALGFALTVVAGLGMRPLLFDVSPLHPSL